MRPISRLRRVVSTIATAGLVLGGIYLGAGPASAQPSWTTRFTTLEPAAGTTHIDAGTSTTIRLAVDVCSSQQICSAPVGFPDPDPESIDVLTQNTTDLFVTSDQDPGHRIHVTLAAAPAVPGGGAVEGGQAIASFDTGNLTRNTTFTFTIGSAGNPSTSWASFLTTNPNVMPTIFAKGASASVTVDMAVAPSINTQNLTLDAMTVGAPFSQTVLWSDYVTGTDISSVTFDSITGLPDGITAQVDSGDSGDSIVISGTPTSTGDGIAYLNLVDGDSSVPGDNSMSWSVAAAPEPTATPTPDPTATPTPDPTDTSDPCTADPGSCDDPCTADPGSCGDPCIADPGSCGDPVRRQRRPTRRPLRRRTRTRRMSAQRPLTSARCQEASTTRSRSTRAPSSRVSTGPPECSASPTFLLASP